ncbi:MAG: glycosyltransferase family 25 protein [Verrucomicrobiota bacterium]|nr:glycosyltransferase family 25 protein [Verrucomicrobiota bacterium]
MGWKDSNTVVITLEDSKDRQAHMNTEMERCGIPFDFFIAKRMEVSAAHGHGNYDRQKRLKRTGFDMSAGEVGCFLSHREVWKNAVRTGKSLLICEDDIRFLHALDFSSQLMRYSPSFDLVRLHGVFPTRYFELGQLQNYSIVSYNKGPRGSAAYWIKPAAAERLLELSQRFYQPVDDFIDEEWRHELRIIGIMPYPVETLALETTITNRRKPALGTCTKLRKEMYRTRDRTAEFCHSYRKRLRYLMGNPFHVTKPDPKP